MPTYRLDYAAFNEHLLNADWMVAEMARRAEQARALAEELAPVYAQGPHPGRYKAAFRVSSGKHGGAHHDRAYAELSNDAPEALSVEFGTEHNDARHVLVQSLDAVGGNVYYRASGSNTPRGEA